MDAKKYTGFMVESDGKWYPMIRESSGGNVYRMWAGAYADTVVFVETDSFEGAFEELVEYLDDYAPGLLVSHAEFRELLDEQAQEAGHPDFAAVEALHAAHDMGDDEFYTLIQDAEADLTMIGHTTMTHGSHIASHEWGGDEVTDEAIASQLRNVWGYGNGSAGCMYDGCSSGYSDPDDAVAAAVEALELDEAEAKELATDSIVYFGGERRSEVGADYVELFEVSADDYQQQRRESGEFQEEV